MVLIFPRDMPINCRNYSRDENWKTIQAGYKITRYVTLIQFKSKNFKLNERRCYLALSTDGLGLGLGIGTTIAGVAPVGDASVVIVIAGAPGLVDKVLTGRSSTRSGVCFCLIVTRCSQKSRLERNPPRTALPLSSCPTAPSST